MEGVWYPRPHISARFARNGKLVKIKGTFRHWSCSRVDSCGHFIPTLGIKQTQLGLE